MASWHRLLASVLAVSVVLLTALTTHAQLWEGNACVLNGKKRGTCKLLTECPSQLKLITNSRRFQPQICSFKGTSPIVCCPMSTRGFGPVRGGSGMTPPPDTPPPTTLPPPTPVPTSGRILSIGGEKADKACREYSKEISSEYPVPLIFGGKATTPGQFPHMALLGYRPKGENNVSWHCGGALISHRFVVTAAHCFTDNMLRAPVVVRLGEHNLKDDNDNAIDYRIKNSIRNPNYRKESWYHDLALIELDIHVQFSTYVQPACIWNKPEDPSSELIVTGWGSTQQDGDGPISDILLEGNGTLSKVPPEICTEFFKAARLQLRMGVQAGILCAMDQAGTVDTCRGDSGGPIQVWTDFSGVGYYVVGVVSGGSKWCGNRIPAIYTSLHTYIDWIEGIVWPDA